MVLSTQLVEVFSENFLDHLEHKNIIFRYGVDLGALNVVFILPCSDTVVENSLPDELSHVRTQVAKIKRLVQVN